ncbi:hypothetical protein DSO57_1024413 [Entomophthora muscae]|uniref:Uncharacterized protein n=1 Tax=Entomophthora muscae TaxID=34485 RepID=A0ACC2U114_9FUNG|nr:hypothetical protein DSO57_1024413 [Entomophthora muscae]
MSYSETRQSPKDNSPNGHQIDANLEPPKIWTYAEVVACLKEVKTKPIINSANDHQQLPVTVGSIMPGIIRPSKKAQKAGKPLSKLTELTDLNQMVNQK